MSAFPNSDLNPVLAAGSSSVSVVSNGTFSRRPEPLKGGSNILTMDVCEPPRRTTPGSAEPGFLCELWENGPEAGGGCRLRLSSLLQKGKNGQRRWWS